MRSIVFVTAAILAVSACHQKTASAPLNNVTDSGDITVRVVNRNVLDVMIYVQHGGLRNRLGLATSSTTTDFRVPIAQLGAGGEYQLIGDPIGQRINVTTEILHARPNDRVIWSIEDSFARSTVVVQ